MNNYVDNNIKIGTTMSLGKKTLYGTYLYPITRPITENTLCVFLIRNNGWINNFPNVLIDLGNTIVYEKRDFVYGDVVLIPYRDLTKYYNTCGSETCDKYVDSDMNETCPICGWLRCSCGYCGCARGYADNRKLHIKSDNIYYSQQQPLSVNYFNFSLEINHAIDCNNLTPLSIYPKVIEVLYKNGIEMYLFIKNINLIPQIVINRSSLNNAVEKVYDIFYKF